MVLESHMKVCMTEPNFWPKNWENGSKMGQKQGFFNLLKKFGCQFLLNLICNEHLYYLLCSCTNPIFEKIFVPEIWTKMLSANQIAGFFNQPCLQNKSMKQPDFLYVDTNSHKLKVNQKIWGWHGQRWVWQAQSQDSKIDCISRMT